MGIMLVGYGILTVSLCKIALSMYRRFQGNWY